MERAPGEMSNPAAAIPPFFGTTELKEIVHAFLGISSCPGRFYFSSSSFPVSRPPPHLFGALNFENCTAKMYANQILPFRTAYMERGGGEEERREQRDDASDGACFK